MRTSQKWQRRSLIQNQMSNLYQIDEAIRSVISMADDNGVINEEAFDQLQMAKAEKQLNIIKYIKHIKNDGEIIDKEIKRLQEMKKSNDKRIESLTTYLSQSMKIDGVKELTFPLFQAKFKKNPPKLRIDSADYIPRKFIKTKSVTTNSIDGDALLKALKAGEEVRGVSIIQEERLAIN